MIKRIFQILFLMLLIFAVIHKTELKYAVVQTYGQTKLIIKAKNSNQILKDTSYSDSLKQQLLFILKVKKFAEDSLALVHTKNYTTFYDAGAKEINWLVMAAYPFELKSYEWKFPLAGKFPYLGFFNPQDANKEASRLKNLGFDVKIGHPTAWSTLKIFKDPVLSTMLRYSKGRLAEIIIHETTHATIFIKNDVVLNENLANFIGKMGATKFLKTTFGINSPQYKNYLKKLAHDSLFRNFISLNFSRLDSLYHTFSDKSDTIKNKSMKDSVMNKIEFDYINLFHADSQRIRYIKNSKYFHNNVNFLQSDIYNSKYSYLNRLFSDSCNGNFSKFIEKFKNRL